MRQIFSRCSYSNWLPVLIGLFLRSINLQSPIVGVHSWRQADTAAMARHFAIEGTPIWLPQIDWAGAGKGYVECEFPLFPYIVGQFYKLFGLHEWIGRGLSILFSVLTILLVIRIGSRIFDPISGWWGGIFFALLPINVYYGRTFQAESLLIFLAALSIECIFTWKIRSNPLALAFSWIAFCLACLIKLLPFIWLGLPLLAVHIYSIDKNHPRSLNQLFLRIFQTLRSPYIWFYILSIILVVFAWFSYAYSLGSSSGLSFFQWGQDTDRFSLAMLLDINIWSNLLLRITARNMAFIGLPLVVIGIWKCEKDSLGGQTLQAGLAGMLICTAFAIRSSAVHEYYQLPLQLFLCPLMGRGWLYLGGFFSNRRLPNYYMTLIICLLTSISLAILSLDYFLVERKQTEIWLPLAQKIRQQVPPGSRIVSVTGFDPTLLNLSRRQGWLIPANKINSANIESWRAQGATYIAGSLNWKESYIRRSKSEATYILGRLQCQEQKLYCPKGPNYTYLIPLRELIE